MMLETRIVSTYSDGIDGEPTCNSQSCGNNSQGPREPVQCVAVRWALEAEALLVGLLVLLQISKAAARASIVSYLRRRGVCGCVDVKYLEREDGISQEKINQGRSPPLLLPNELLLAPQIDD